MERLRCTKRGKKWKKRQKYKEMETKRNTKRAKQKIDGETQKCKER